MQHLLVTTKFGEMIDPKPICISNSSNSFDCAYISTIQGIAFNGFSFFISLDTVPQSKTVKDILLDVILEAQYLDKYK